MADDRKQKTNVSTRPASRADAGAIARLSRELRAAIGEPRALFSEDVILRDGFGKKPEFQVVVAERDGDVAGYALFYDAYEPGYAARGVYLADLVVGKSARRLGIGRVLIAAVEAAAAARGRSYVWWIVPPDNADALRFYEELRPEVTQGTVLHVKLVG